MSQKLRVGVTLDNPKRDLRGSLLLISALARAGVEAYLMPMYNQYYEIPLIGLDALIVNCARKTNQEQLANIRKLGTRIYVLDTEAGLLSKTGPRSPDGWASFIRDSGLAENIDGYFFWGHALYQGFLRQNVLPAEKLHVTGTPRYDVLHPRWRKILKAPREGIILVNSNFAGVNPRFTRSVDFEIKMAVEAGIDLELVRAILRDQQQIMNGFVDSIRELASRRKERRFVFRPHPFEGEEVYRKAFTGLDNVILDSSGEVFDVLSGTEFLIQLNCTTAVDAFLLDKPSIGLEYLNTNLFSSYIPLPRELSYNVHSIDELDALVANPSPLWSHISSVRDRVQSEVISMFGSTDGDAAKRIVEVILHNHHSKEQNQQRPEAAREASPKLSLRESLLACQSDLNWRPALQGAAINLFGSENINRIRGVLKPRRKEKFVPMHEVRRLLMEIERLYDPPHAISSIAAARHPWLKWSLGSIQVTPS
jgi:surface carbohydrate biosynthesis protein